MRESTASRAAAALVLVGVAIAVAAAVMHVRTRDVPIEYYGVRGFQGAFGVIIAATGWLIVSRRHRNPIGWIFVGSGLASCAQAFDSAYGTYSIARHGGSLPFTEVFVWLGVWIWVLIVGPLSTWVLILFPEGHFETRKQRWLAVFAGVAIAAFCVVTAFTPGQAGELPIGTRNPYALSKEASDAISPLMSLYVIAVALSITVLVRRFRRSRGEMRQQMKLLTYAASFAAVFIVFSTVALGSGASASDPVIRISAIGTIASFVSIPVAAGIAILRYGLYEIDVVINKTIVYALLAVFITVVYVGVVVGIGALVGAGANTGLSVAATAIVAVAVQPVRERAGRLANRLVFGKRATPYEALSEFSAHLSEQGDDVMGQLARLMTEATAAQRAAVWLAIGEEFRPVASSPADLDAQAVAREGQAVLIPEWDRVYPVRHEGELLGALTVSMPPNDPLTASEERLLSDLASQAGLLLRNARLIAELRASRRRLVEAQDTERRRIERDLHDGAQQQLVALSVKLNLLGRLLGDASQQARDMVEQLRTEANEALQNLRDLVHGIYPPLLAERGLVAALEAQAAKAPLGVTVDGDGVGRYPQEVEAAVYFCVLEALQNAAKYSAASNATVKVRADDGRLGFEVRDDGKGFDVERARRGAGLTNMADRLDALGGRLDVSSTPGSGTTIAGWIAAAPA